jgi:predicted Zn-dependent protease
MKKLLLTLLFLIISFSAQAISIISDEETESWLADVLTPIFKSADITFNRDNIHIVKDDSLNAFVGDANHMFIHTGTILDASNTNEIEGVLAHETGHILGGHILRLKIKIKELQKASLASLIAAAGAAAVSGRGDTAIAVVLGTQSSAINAMSSYQITEERAADEAAVNLLSKQNKSIKGLKNFMEKIRATNRLEGIEETPYFRTHPITTERISFFNDKLKTESSPQNSFSMDTRLNRIKAKLFAYLSPLDKVLKKYPLTDNSINAQIAHTIYYMRLRNLNKASQYIDNLILKETENPYFWELKAQILLENLKVKEAIKTYEHALQLKPTSDLFKLSYAEALLSSTPSRKELNSLIVMLEHANRNKSYPLAYHLLGKVYSLLGDQATANYFSAEYNNAIGNYQLAQKQLNKSLQKPLRSDIKLRAEDLKQKLNKDNSKKTLL